MTIMKFEKGIHYLNQKNLLPKGRDTKYGWNRARTHFYKYESMAHWLTKCIIVKLILKQDEPAISEFEYYDGRTVDVLQIKKNGDLVAYEVENSDYKKAEPEQADLIVIDLRKMPDDIKKSIKKIERWIRRFVV